MAESGGLLNRYTSKIVSGVRIPLSPPSSIRARAAHFAPRLNAPVSGLVYLIVNLGRVVGFKVRVRRPALLLFLTARPKAAVEHHP